MSDASPLRLVLLTIRQMLVVSLLAAVAAMAFLATMQRRAIYPLGYEGRPTPPSPTGFRPLRVKTPSGNLLVWRHDGTIGRPVLLFLHGNAAGIASTAYVARPFMDAGWTVVAPEYPGYPGNDGSPSEEGLLNAARAGWRTTLMSGHVPRDVVILGNSIGSGPAIALAAETNPRGLAIVSGIASLPQVIRQRFPFVPDMLVWDRFDNARTLRRVKAPVLVIHGDVDDVVATEQGQALAQSAGTDLVVAHGGHEIMGRRAIQDMVLRRFETR